MGPRALLMFCWLFFVSFHIVTVQTTLAILLFFAPLGFQRRIFGWSQRAWVEGVGLSFPEVQLCMSGDKLPTDCAHIVIVNHQVDADWWFMWILGKAYALHGRIKIILKAGLKKIPVLGSGMRNFEFIFLQRNWADDKSVLTAQLESFVSSRLPFSLLLFPEGTTIHQEALDKGLKFAKEQKRPMMKNVLLPRTTGFEAVLKASQTAVKEVYDVTMCYTGYTGDIPTWDDGYGRKRDKELPNLMKMASGVKPGPVYLHVQKYMLQDILDQGVQQWLDERWVEKDALMGHFATTGKMPASLAKNTVVFRDQGNWGNLLVLFLLSLANMTGLACLLRYLYLTYV